MLCAGLALGIWLGKRLMTRLTSGITREELHELIQGVSKVTHGVQADMSQYREVMDLAQQHLREVQEGSQPADTSTVDLLSRMTDANELLQRRIRHAEGMLARQSAQVAEFMTEARTDALTHVPNRRAFDDEFNRRMAEWRRNSTRFLLVLIDVDHFKRLNDTHGHAAGDAVLRQLASTLQQATRETDLVARYGGEEFVLLLPAGAMGYSTDCGPRICQAVAATKYRFEDQTLAVTVSCGVAEPRDKETPLALLQRADAALYAAKQAGRNRSYFHDGQGCVPLGDHPVVGGNATQEAAPKPPSPSTRPSSVRGSRDENLSESAAEFTQVCDDLRRRLAEVTNLPHS